MPLEEKNASGTGGAPAAQVPELSCVFSHAVGKECGQGARARSVGKRSVRQLVPLVCDGI